MKQNRTILYWLLLLLTVGVTSCDELADPVFASEDNPAPGGSSTPTPDIQIDNATLTLSVGQSATRQATVNSPGIPLIYASSTPAVATVSQTGKVTAITAGETTITVSAPQISKSVSFKVVVNAISAEQLAAMDKATPLTLVALADGKITVTFNNGITLAGDIHYTINDGQEQTIAKNTTGAYDIEVKKGDVVQLYSLNSALGGGSNSAARVLTRAVDEGAKYINIRPSMKTEIFGNVTSLLKGKDNLESATTIEANNAFYGLFAAADKLVNNDERLLVLPATTLTEGCYQDMFNGCKGIEKAPELPAPKLEKNCYQEMFYDCAKLNHVKCLATDISAENCTKDWLGKAGTEATGEKVLETAVPMTPNSDDGVPVGWTAQTDGATAVTSIALDKTELALTVGDAAAQLKATVLPEDATDKTVTWSSDKTSVATVDATGKVTAVAEGEATITAKAGDKTATCTVTVTAATVAVTSVALDKTELVLIVGDAAAQLKATVLPEDATDKTVTWSSDKTSVATVDGSGLVTAVAAGEATITAKAGDKTATCKITVTVVKVPDPTINPSDNYENDGNPLASK